MQWRFGSAVYHRWDKWISTSIIHIITSFHRVVFAHIFVALEGFKMTLLIYNFGRWNHQSDATKLKSKLKLWISLISVLPPPSVQESFCGIWNHDDDSGATFSRAGKVLQFSPALSTRLAAVLKHAIKKITRSLYSTKQARDQENDDVSLCVLGFSHV